jgi:predicted ATP-grasp superfamily ATP-dependent carboligase
LKAIKSVLITEASQKNALACVRSLGKEGIKVFVIANHFLDISRFSKYCSGSLVISHLDKDAISDFIKKKDIDLVMPVGTNSVKFFCENNSFFKDKIQYLIPSESQINLAMSKKSTMEAAQKLDIPVPKTLFPISIEDAKDHAAEIGFPCVIKWIYEVGENVVDYAHSEEEFSEKYLNMCNKYNFNTETGFPMVQEFIDGVGVGFFGLFYNGRCIDYYQHQRVREAPPSGGVSVCAQTIYDNSLQKYGESLLSNLKWNGVAMVEFKMLKDNSLVLMEINPKFWGSLDLGIKAGANFPVSIVNLLSKSNSNTLNASGNYSKNVKFYWPFDGDISYMFNDFGRFKNVCKDMLNPNVKSNISIINDPLPTIIQIMTKILILFRNLFK